MTAVHSLEEPTSDIWYKIYKLFSTSLGIGLTKDHKLSWKPHINKVLDSGCSLMRALASKTRGLYGPKPKLMKWTYTGIVRPKITYGCMIWGHKINLKKHGKQLNRLNRMQALPQLP